MKSSERGSGNPEQEPERMKQLLRAAMPPVADESVDRDLWPAMLRRMDQQAVRGIDHVPWWDWALVSGLVGFAAILPRSIPVILYYL